MEFEIQELLNQGIAFMTAKSYPSAVETFRKILALDGANLDAYIHLGNAYVCLNQYDKAIANFKTALTHHNDNGRLYFSLGSVYMLTDDIPQAVRCYNRAQKAGYRTVDLYLILAGAFMDSGDCIQAIRAISGAIELQPLRAGLYIKKSALQMQFEMFDEALATLAEYRELNPDAYETYSQSVQILCIRKDFAGASALAEEAIARFPKDPGVLLMKLQILVESGKHAEAVSYADKVLALDPRGEILYKATMYKASACAMTGKLDQVVTILKSYSQLDKDPNALFMLMNTCVMKKDFAGVKAAATALEALDAEPSMNAAALYYKANAIERMEGIEKARDVYARILPQLRRISLKVPHNYEIYIYRILAHTSCGEYDKALELAEYLEKAYPELPDGPMYKYHVYSTSGDKKNAALAREAALKIAPGLQLAPVK